MLTPTLCLLRTTPPLLRGGVLASSSSSSSSLATACLARRSTTTTTSDAEGDTAAAATTAAAAFDAASPFAGFDRVDVPGWGASIEIPVQWGDMDVFQHVNNVKYVRWFESARIAHMRLLKLAAANGEPPADGISVILADTAVRYVRPVTWPDRVTVSTRSTHLGTTSWSTEYRVTSARQDGVVVTRGSARCVFFDYRRQRKTACPEYLRATLLAECDAARREHEAEKSEHSKD